MQIERTWAVMVLTAVVPAVPLGVVGCLGWVRTKALRRGTVEAAVGRGEIRTSAATFIPALCGVSVGAAGLLMAAGGSGGAPVGAMLLITAGVAIALLGLAARVTALTLDNRGLSVRFGWRRSFDVAWTEIVGVSPPRWPLGGWAVRSRTGMRLLMPSDLVGHEGILIDIVGMAGLRFEGRAWTT